MRSPAEMQIALIDITNACNQSCSNCTRFCGNHKKPFFMDFETFKRAVDSYEGFDGLVGFIGGEPTLHPEFERFTSYIHEVYGGCAGRGRLIHTRRGYIEEIRRRAEESHVLRRRADGSLSFLRSGPCLFTNGGVSYRKHYEQIQDTFPVLFLNDHINPSSHKPGLFSRRDLDIPDALWFPLRDACWLQNTWSASITPKGAFFCEIAAAMDMLFDGPGGWPIEPGWWKRTPEDFGEQLQWCELCGFALDTFWRDAGDGVDDVSPTLYRMLEAAGSPRLRAGKTNLVTIRDGAIAEESKAQGTAHASSLRYIAHYEDRFNADNAALGAEPYQILAAEEGGAFGAALNRALAEGEWLLLLRTEEDRDRCAGDAEALLRDEILNPGTLILGEGFLLFSRRALSLRRLGFDRIARLRSEDDLIAAWDPGKVIRTEEIPALTSWKLEGIVPGRRYAIWGAGILGSYFADAVRSSGGVLTLAVDSDPAKWGSDFYAAEVRAPAYLSEHGGEYDHVILANYTAFEQMRRDALALGVEESKLLMPYEV